MCHDMMLHMYTELLKQRRNFLMVSNTKQSAGVHRVIWGNMQIKDLSEP